MSLLLVFTVLTLLAVTLSVLLLALVHRRRTERIVELDLLGDDHPGTAGPTEDVRVLRRHVAVLTSALGEWEAEVPAAPATPDQHGSPHVHAVASWTSLSRDLAGRGEVERSAMALWAADLHVLAPHLVGREAELVARLEELPADTALGTLRRAREIALSLLADTAGPVTAMLAPADHVSRPGTAGEGSREYGGRRTTTAADPAALLAVAEHWRGRARLAAASRQLGLEGREAEMAAFEAALVDSAHHHGDTRLTSVGLRADLARVVVGGLPQPEPGGDPASDELRVRGILHQLLPHHERQRHDALVTARGSR